MSLIIPGSYADGFAPRDREPAYPSLWSGCVGAWAPCLGPSGVTLRDWSPSKNHGTLTNMVTADDWVCDNKRHALDFDGVNDQVVAGPCLSGKSNSITVSAWVNITSLPTRGAIVKIGNDQSDGFGFGIGSTTFDGSGSSFLGIYEGIAWINPGITLSTGVQNLTIRINSSGAMEFFVNGKSLGSASGGMRSPGSLGAITVNIGGYFNPFSGGFARFCNVRVYDVMVYDRVCQSNEIATLSSRIGAAYEYNRRRRAQATAATGGVAKPVLFHSHYMSQGMRP